MKITFYQFLLGILCSNLGLARDGLAQDVLNRPVTVKAENVELVRVLGQIERQADVRFVYSTKISTRQRVSLNLVGRKLSAVLDDILTPLAIGYEVVEDRILLRRVSRNQTGSRVPEPAQALPAPADVTISGRVTDEAGAGIPAVNISVKGTTRGTNTDGTGRYAVAVPDQRAVLVFSSVGYEKQEVFVGNRTELNVTLKAAVNSLDEVVVVGYGTQRRADITGSTGSISEKEITQTPVMGLDQALTGRLAGVQVIQSNNAPGGAIQVQIRGVGGLNGGNSGQPLYVVDGVPVYANDGETTNAESWRQDVTAGNNPNASSPLAGINPNDIESIDVLKDASATAIYGSRAANGVVIVTTKSGKAGRTRLNVDVYSGVQTLSRWAELLNATEAMVLYNERQLNSRGTNNGIWNYTFNPYTYAEANASTDWQKVLFTTGTITDANLTLSGGTAATKFTASGNYFGNKGIVVNSYTRRASFRVNVDGAPARNVTYGVRAAFSTQWGNAINDNDNNSSIIQRAYEGRAWQTGQNPDGSYYGPPVNSSFWDSNNAYYEALETQRTNDRKRFTGNAFVEYQFLPGLKFKTLFGTDYNYLFQHYATIPAARGEIATTAMYGIFNNVGRIFDNYSVSTNWVADQTLTYDATINRHKINAVAGFSAQKNVVQATLLRGDGPLNPVLNQINNVTSIATFRGGVVTSGLVSQFVRANYSYRDRYLFTGTVRRDGSSRFGPGNRYGIFPSASVGWRLSQEPFLANNNLVSDLKIRGSWGLTGNQNIGDFSFISRVLATTYAWGNAVADGQSPANLANPDLKWESNEQIDLGLELSLLKNRVSLTTDLFRKRSSDLLYSAPIPYSSGFVSQLVNLGKVENKGLEVSIQATILPNDFRWRVNYNMTFLRNTVLDLGRDQTGNPNVIIPGPVNLGFNANSDNSPTVVQEGLPIGSFIGYRSAGVYQTYADIESSPRLSGVVSVPGDVKYVDVNGDGVVDSNDRVIIGNPFPDFYGGLVNDFSYKNFSLNVIANFSVGNTVYNYARQRFSSSLLGGYKEQVQRWTGEGTSNDLPRQSNQNFTANRYISDRFMEDGSFFRLRTVTLNYTLPRPVASKLRLQNATFFVSGSNLLLLTKYSGLDPEVSGSGGNAIRAGFDYGLYPNPRTFNAGFKLSL